MSNACAKSPLTLALSANLLIAIWPLVSGANETRDEAGEPPVELNVSLGNQNFDIFLDQTQDINFNGQTVSIRVKQRPTRTIRLRNLSFTYPSYFLFKSKLHDKYGVPIRWEVEGDDVELTLFRLVDDPIYDDISASADKFFRTAFRPLKTSPAEEVALDWGSKRITGRRRIVRLGLGTDIQSSVEFYVLPGIYDGCRYVVTIVGRDGDNPKEERLLIDLLAETATLRESNQKSHD